MHSSAGAIIERDETSANPHRHERNEFRVKDSMRTSMDTRMMRYTEE